MDGPPFFWLFHLRFRGLPPKLGMFSAAEDFRKGNTDDNINGVLSSLCGSELVYERLKSYSFKPLSHESLLSAATEIQALVRTK